MFKRIAKLDTSDKVLFFLNILLPLFTLVYIVAIAASLFMDPSNFKTVQRNIPWGHGEGFILYLIFGHLASCYCLIKKQKMAYYIQFAVSAFYILIFLVSAFPLFLLYAIPVALISYAQLKKHKS